MLNNNIGVSDLGQKYFGKISSVISVFITWEGVKFSLGEYFEVFWCF